MNQILAGGNEPNKGKENSNVNSIENNTESPYEINQEFDSISNPSNYGINYDESAPYDVSKNFDNMQDYANEGLDYTTPSAYETSQNFDNMENYANGGLDYTAQSTYETSQNFDNMQDYANGKLNYTTPSTYETSENFDAMQNYANEENQQYENQINYTNVNNGQTIQKLEIKKVIRIFCIVIIIFALAIGGKSIYSFIKNKNSKKDNPIVNIDKMGREATISITTEKPIKEYTYQWNKDGEPEVEEGNGRVSIEKTIQIPNGNNILNITVTDYYGNKTKYFKQYIYESSDIVKPTINLATVGNQLKISAEDNSEMLYMTYQWNDEPATRIDVSQDNKTVIEAQIDVPKGQNRLTIIAVDKEENKETRTENIVGANKPTFDIQTDGENIVVIASDEEGISKISITIDDQTTDSGDEPINQKQITAKLPITRGSHTITVTVTNINGLSETQSVTHTF